MLHPQMHKMHSVFQEIPSGKACTHTYMHIQQETNIYPKIFCQSVQHNAQAVVATVASRAQRELSKPSSFGVFSYFSQKNSQYLSKDI